MKLEQLFKPKPFKFLLTIIVFIVTLGFIPPLGGFYDIAYATVENGGWEPGLPTMGLCWYTMELIRFDADSIPLPYNIIQYIIMPIIWIISLIFLIGLCYYTFKRKKD